MGLRYFFSAYLLFETIAQRAARMAIYDIADKFECACKDPSNSLDELEKRIISQNMPLIESLIREHELRKGLASKYKYKMLGELFVRAGSRGDFVWQAALAKKYKL